MYVSIVVPVYNEEESLDLLCAGLSRSLKALGRDYEIIMVDDGSRDGSNVKLKAIAAADPLVKVITLRRNYGQTAAIVAGFDHAQGEYIVTLDADLQNDPKDIPPMLKKAEEGFDLISGWRRQRKDLLISRRLPSFMANWIIVKMTGVKLHDYGCTLKVYRKEFLRDINLYGEMHRYIPVYIAWMGGRISEMEVAHHPRKYGISKYGIERTMKVIFDLLTVKLLLGSYFTSPLYFFGRWGVWLIMSGALCGAITIVQKIFYGAWVHRNPLLLLAVFFILIGAQAIFMGLLAEINIRIYYESTKRSIYSIVQKINI